jgi:hypothetical protein
MQVKIFITKKEITQVVQQAILINNGEQEDDTIISLTIYENRIAVDVPNMARSMQRQIVVDRSECLQSDVHQMD